MLKMLNKQIIVFKSIGIQTTLILLLSTFKCFSAELEWPPQLPESKTWVSDVSNDFLKPAETLRPGIKIAKTPPRIDFLYYPKQTYPGNPWSVWGDGCVANGKYYSAIGDHGAPQGNAFVYEYDPNEKSLKCLLNLDDLLDMPDGHYMPGKIHSRIDMGSDGWLYFATHRGSTRVTTDEYHYKGDWIIRHHPKTGESEILVHAPIPKHCIPTSVLDPKRLIFYGGTAAGDYDDKTIMFFAYDIARRKVLHSSKDGPYRYLIFSRSTGRVYYVNEDYGDLMRYNPESGLPPKKIQGRIGLRAATRETPDGYVYTVSKDGGTIWRFNTKTEAIKEFGSAPVGTSDYITSIDASPSGRYLYYIPGAHGGSERDGSPIVQFDTKTKTKKVIAFLHPYLQQKYGYVPLGTFSSALNNDGSTLYVTWNGNRSGRNNRNRYPFDTCALTVIHIPESERIE